MWQLFIFALQILLISSNLLFLKSRKTAKLILTLWPMAVHNPATGRGQSSLLFPPGTLKSPSPGQPGKSILAPLSSGNIEVRESWSAGVGNSLSSSGHPHIITRAPET